MTNKLLDNIYVINLKKSVDRLNIIKDNFDRYNIKFNRFDAHYGKELPNEAINSNTSLVCKNILCNYGMIGCAMSHMDLWKKLVNDTNVDHYIIFEDDALIGDDFMQTIGEIDNLKHNLNFDILSLYCGPGPNCIHIKNISTLKNGVNVGKPLFPLSLTSYIISKQGAQKLLAMINKINYHIDMDIAIKNLFGDITYLSLNQNLIRHNWETESTIEHHNSKSILLNILNSGGFINIYWLLNVSVFTVNLKYTVNLYQILLIILIVICIISGAKIIAVLLILELVLTFI